jgi:replicative DNA helicase|tara:strand:+ start:367 stop:1893 length:1527 start_codon:yes stop_codon:yes gene_type:complete
MMATGAQQPVSLSPAEGEERTLPSFRSPPHNFEAEKALLGALMANNNAYDRVSDFLRPEQFADPVHGRIYEAIAKLLDANQIADPVTLINFFEQDDTLADVGGSDYLAELAASMVSIINAREYGQIIYDLHLKRQLIDFGEQVVNRAFSPEVDDPSMMQIGDAEQQLYDLAMTGELEGGFQAFDVSIKEAIMRAEIAHKRDGRLAGVGTGLRDIDDLLGGFHPSDLIILAGRPSMGKTALATNIAFNAAYDYETETDANGNTRTINGAVVGFFSLEMSSEQLAARILSEQTEIASDKMRRGTLTNEEFDKLVEAARMLHNLPIFIDDTPALTVNTLRTRARRLKSQHNLGLVIVDYLQLMQGNLRTDNRVLEIGEITRGLKTLAKELEVPVLALSQLSRAVEQREDKRPLLSDLRESGTIEQDSDVVSFIFREAYYLERGEPVHRQDESTEKFSERHERWQTRSDEMKHRSELIIAKQRHGPTGNVSLYFDGTYTRFADLDTQHTDTY